jgi:uncharacterized phiE125 gp8 family phage protein
MKYTTEGTLVSGTLASPVSRTEFKQWARIDSGTADDTLIDALLVAATQQAEKYTGRAFVTRNFEVSLDACDIKSGTPIKLTRQPLVGVSSFQYRGSDGSFGTWGTGNYVVDTPGARLSEGTLGGFPAAYAPDAGAYKIPFTAGYGTSGTSTPDVIRTAIQVQTLLHYENRGGAIRGETPTDLMEGQNLDPAVRSLLNPFRVDLI